MEDQPLLVPIQEERLDASELKTGAVGDTRSLHQVHLLFITSAQPVAVKGITVERAADQ